MTVWIANADGWLDNSTGWVDLSLTPFNFFDENGDLIQRLSFEEVYPGRQTESKVISFKNNLNEAVDVDITCEPYTGSTYPEKDTNSATLLSLDETTWSHTINVTADALGTTDFYIFYRPPSTATIGSKRWNIEVSYNGDPNGIWDKINTFTVTSVSATDQTDVVIPITLPYSAGNMETDFEDIVFYDWFYQLDHTMLNKVDSTSADFHIEIPLLFAGEERTLYVWGDNSTATYTDMNVYTDYWDWTDGTLDPWTILAGTVNVNTIGWGDHYSLELYNYGGSTWPSTQVDTTGAYGIWEMKYHLESTSSMYAHWYFIHDGTNYYQVHIRNNEEDIELYYNGTLLDSAALPKSAATRYLKVTRDLDGNFKVYVDGTEYLSATDNNLTTSIQQNLVFNTPSFGHSWYIDYINYVELSATTPTVGALTGWDDFVYSMSVIGKVGYDVQNLPGIDGILRYGIRIDGELYE
jgi:hypothetical protein